MPVGALMAIAIVIEVVGTGALRQSDGFTRPGWVVLMLGCYLVSFYLLSVVVREVSLGMTYAIWSGAGTALIAIVGAVVFGERFGAPRLVGMGLVLLGLAVIVLPGRGGPVAVVEEAA